MAEGGERSSSLCAKIDLRLIRSDGTARASGGGHEMTAEQGLTRAQMDALVDGHYRAEEAGDLDAIVDGFAPDAEHDVVGRPGDPLRGGEQIADFYRSLFTDIRVERLEPVRRWYGDDHVVDESILHATAVGRPFGFEGRGRPVRTRFLHIFDFSDGLISRESA
jgi:ketosteroid isomerase-like protein